jgi:hypothetical protein
MGYGRSEALGPCSCAGLSGSWVAHSAGPLSREWAAAVRPPACVAFPAFCDTMGEEALGTLAPSKAASARTVWWSVGL